MMADDMGMGDVGYYGLNDRGVTVLTPHLDNMSTNGLRLDRFYAQAPVCSPTRGSCLSGRHPFRYGIWQANQGSLRPEEIALPTILKEHAGYTSAHFGKWHLGALNTSPSYSASGMDFSPPSRHGFDEWFSVHHSVKTYDPYGTDGVPGGTSDAYTGDDNENNPYFTQNPDTNDWNGVEHTAPLFGDTSEYLVDRAIPFMSNAVTQGKPFLVCLWFHTPHKDLDASADDQALYAGDSDSEKRYYGAITAMDRQIGRVRTWLLTNGIADNTLLWFTCDNGETGGSSGPFRGAKRHLFEGGIRVPTVLEWPMKIASPRVTPMPASTSDYFYTCLDAAGIDYSDTRPRDGISLLPLIENRMDRRPGTLAFQSHGTSVIMNQEFKAMLVRTGAYSDGLAQSSGFPLDQWFLIDIVNDPYETTDVSATHPAALQALSEEYDAWNETCRDSYNGDDYGIPGYDPGGTYKENADL
jgi:arylsulfatase A-like enzyme